MKHSYAHRVLMGAAAAPLTAHTAVSDVLGIMNIFVGLMIVAAAILFFGGLITWSVLLGATRRVIGIRLMEWGVVILFVLTILLAIVQFFQKSPAASTFAVSAMVVVAVGWAIFKAVQEPAAPPEKK